MRGHFGLFRLFELCLVLGLIAVCVSFFESASKKGGSRKKLDDLEDRVSDLEKSGKK
jgi:hypothetical protein